MLHYHLEVIGLILMLALFGLVFNPFFGGCLVLLSLLIIIMSVMVFFSFNLIWIIMLGAVFYIYGWGHKYYKWLRLPLLKEYIELFPSCKLVDGVACKYCNSSNTIHLGLFNQNSRWRYCLCKSCGQLLYRFTII